MVTCMVIAIPISLLILMCSIITSSLGVVVLVDHGIDMTLLLFIIGGFITAGLLAILMLFRLHKTLMFFILQCLAYLFQIVTGIVLMISIIHDHYKGSMVINGWEVAVPTIFVINVFFIAASITMFGMLFLQGRPNHQDIDLEKDTGSNTEHESNISSSTFRQDMITKSDRLVQEHDVPQDVQVTKKISGQTLVDNMPKFDTYTVNKNNFQNEEIDFPYILEYPPSDEKFTSDDYLHYTNNNWMDSGTNLQSINLSTDLDDHLSAKNVSLAHSKKPSFGLFRINSKLNESTKKLVYENMKTTKALKNSTSVPNFSGKRSIDKILKFDNLKSDFTSNNTPNPPFARKLTHNLSQHSLPTNMCELDITKSRRISLINSNLNKLPSLQPVLLEDHERNTSSVKRTKSASHLNSENKKIRKNQRRKSIHDEKTFLQGVNESLLPPVLKTSESPILELKRQQQELLDRQSQEYYTSPLSRKGEKRRPNDESFDKDSKLKLVDEIDDDVIQFSDSEISKDAKDRFSSTNLPYIPEFEPPIDQEHFKGFDQDTALIQNDYSKDNMKHHRKKGIYEFNEDAFQTRHGVDQSSLRELTDDEYSEDYNNSLSGLEKIPKSSSFPNVLWNSDSNDNKVTSIRHISLKEWDDNSALWNEKRTRLGANLNIPGITRLVSDHNLKTVNLNDDTSLTQNMNGSLLLPPLEFRMDNIDNLSDLKSATGSINGNDIMRRASNTSLSRSLSAPSLYTYRDLVSNTDTEHSVERLKIPINLHGSSIRSLETTLQNLKLSPERRTSTTSNSSPIKRFFQESPKRLNNAFKGKSMNTRYSLDLGSLKDPNSNYHHKHSNSVASAYSTKSSKSNSPRKSLRALLNISPTKNQGTVTPAVMSKPSHAIAENAEYGSLNYSGDDSVSFWDLETAQSSSKSRISSVPSAVIGEYDREKWRTLKSLQNQQISSLGRSVV